MKFKLKQKKLMRIGYSYFIILPIEWVRNHNLGDNDFVDMLLSNENELILKPVKKVIYQRNVLNSS